MPLLSLLGASTLSLSFVRSTALPTEIVHSIFRSLKTEQISNPHQSRFGSVCAIWRAVSLDSGEYHIRSLDSLLRLVDLFRADLGRCNGARRIIIELDFLRGPVVDTLRGMKDLLEMSMNLEVLELRLELCYEATVVAQEWEGLFVVMERLVKMREFGVRGFPVQVETLFRLLQCWRSLKALDLSTDGVGFEKYLSSTELQGFLATVSLVHFPRLVSLHYMIATPEDLSILDILFSTSNLRSLQLSRYTDSPHINAGLSLLLGPVLPDLIDYRYSSANEEAESSDGWNAKESFDTKLFSSLRHCETLHLNTSNLSSLSFLSDLKRLKKLTLVNVRRANDFDSISTLLKNRAKEVEFEIGFQYIGYINLRTREWLRTIREECGNAGVEFQSTSIVPWTLSLE